MRTPFGRSPSGGAAANPAADNIQAIIDVERQAAREASFGERVSDGISRFVGSLGFLALQTLWMLGWVAWNSMAPVPDRFDPYPFGLLTFVVSLEGVLIATFVLIAQNRMSRLAEERAHLNLQIDMLAEQEMTVMLKMLRRIADRLKVAPEDADEARAEKLAEQTNVYELVQALRRELPEKNGR